MYYLTFILLLSVVILSATSAPTLQIPEDEDEAEIAVPRSPKIQGSQTEYLIFPVGYEIKNLTCEVEGIPMPKVIWIKDGTEVQRLTHPTHQEEFDAETGLATLKFPEKLLLNDDNNSTLAGNYTCVAANFLGRAKKTYILSFNDIEEIEIDTSTLTAEFATETTTLIP